MRVAPLIAAGIGNRPDHRRLIDHSISTREASGAVAVREGRTSDKVARQRRSEPGVRTTQPPGVAACQAVHRHRHEAAVAPEGAVGQQHMQIMSRS
jgi:hypothetical protein